MNPLAARVMSTVAGQLGNPHGLLGKGTAVMLNRVNRFLIDEAVQAAAARVGETVADIGFGGGVGISLLLEQVGPTGNVVGIEISPDMLTRARSGFSTQIAAGRLRVEEGSLTALPLDDASLDAAITVNTIYFVPELDQICAEFARVLRPQGKVVIGIGDPAGMARMPFTQYGFRIRPVADVIAALEAAGLVVEDRLIDHKPIPGHLLIARPKN
ncbi:MAG: S-adenosyl-L-methionine-dependent methyltransferase [Nocardia sp.]|uniref:class I SAM-dependent methyltransferase n=1 Tax=Nocardia sp. TaxID=1821 RepID=UPI0026257D64|nr:methyltransferase domain-containing protein [Nocardia sp.]MCU1640074.1 S-adenosyl-L-methionine-dependent methyltransferase [Nocardia sp.]